MDSDSEYTQAGTDGEPGTDDEGRRDRSAAAGRRHTTRNRFHEIKAELGGLSSAAIGVVDASQASVTWSSFDVDGVRCILSVQALRLLCAAKLSARLRFAMNRVLPEMLSLCSRFGYTRPIQYFCKNVVQLFHQTPYIWCC